MDEKRTQLDKKKLRSVSKLSGKIFDKLCYQVSKKNLEQKISPLVQATAWDRHVRKKIAKKRLLSE